MSFLPEISAEPMRHAAACSWPIVTIEKASGIIATDWMESPREYADCGDAPLANQSATLVRINFVARAIDNATSVTVNTTFRVGRSFGGPGRVINCASTGEFERAVHVYLDCASKHGEDGSVMDSCMTLHDTSPFEDQRRWCFDVHGGPRCSRSPDACAKARRLSSMATSDCAERTDPKAQ